MSAEEKVASSFFFIAVYDCCLGACVTQVFEQSPRPNVRAAKHT